MFAKLKDTVVTNKTIILRADLNVPLKDGKIIDDNRIIATLPTIKWLLNNKAKIVLISHIGRPKGVDKNLSMKVVAGYLENFLDEKIHFCDDCIGNEVQKTVDNAKYGSIIVLENLRFYPDEEDCGEDFTRKLASLGTIYVNDAFACSHRKHASIFLLPQLVKPVAGLNLAHEIESINRIFDKSTPKEQKCAIVGGSKVSTKIDIINNLSDKVNEIFIAGAMANTFLLAQGFEIGKSLAEKNLIEKAKEIMQNLKAKNVKLTLPSDVVVGNEISDNATVKNILIKDIKSDDIIGDIGAESVENIAKSLKNYKVVLWNGPLGAYEFAPYKNGSINLANAIAKATEKGLISIAGGGDAVACVNLAKCGEKFSFISTAGAAFLEYIEGKTLPGIQALEAFNRVED